MIQLRRDSEECVQLNMLDNEDCFILFCGRKEQETSHFNWKNFWEVGTIENIKQWRKFMEMKLLNEAMHKMHIREWLNRKFYGVILNNLIIQPYSGKFLPSCWS